MGYNILDMVLGGQEENCSLFGTKNFKRLMSAKLDRSGAWKILDPNSLDNLRA